MEPLYGVEQYWRLVLSDNFSTSQDILKEVFKFPGGEPHIKLSIKEGFTVFNSFEPIRIYHTIKSFEDFGVLCMAVNALKSKLGSTYISLILPYFPGARQDRIAVDVIEPLSVKVYADLINSLQLNEVIIFDPHSEVAPALINNCVVLTSEKFVEAAVPKDVPFCLVSPDAGAAKKTEKVYDYLFKQGLMASGIPEVIYCRKRRDMKTGKLSGFYIEPVNLEGLACIIVDDICDGGRTFIGVAERLKLMNCGDLHLVVSHGIFSNGFTSLLKHFKTITTTNSWANSDMYFTDSVGAAPGPGIQLHIIDLVKLYNL